MSVKQEAAKLNTGMRNTVPLVHNITNYVTVNDCANAPACDRSFTYHGG